MIDPPPNKHPEVESAIEAFVRGFSYTRSFTHPYLAERFGPVWLLRDGPCTRGDYRNEEWVAHGVAPAEVDLLAREQTRGRYAVCAIHTTNEPDAPLRDGYKALGYRLMTSEPLMVHDLQAIPEFASPGEVRRVLDRKLADRLAREARTRQVLRRHLSGDNSLRQYVAVVPGELAGWVRSITAGSATWCSNMFVKPEYRRRGIARAMLSRMLQNDRAGGASMAVLLASHTGALLYPVLGYRQIGTLLLFTPGKRA